MTRVQRTYTTEFKREAVHLVSTSGKGLTQTACDLGIPDSTLSHWCHHLRVQGADAFFTRGHQTALEAENRHLKQELEEVRQERDALKKTVAIFTCSHP